MVIHIESTIGVELNQQGINTFIVLNECNRKLLFNRFLFFSKESLRMIHRPPYFAVIFIQNNFIIFRVYMKIN